MRHYLQGDAASRQRIVHCCPEQERRQIFRTTLSSMEAASATNPQASRSERGPLPAPPTRYTSTAAQTSASRMCFAARPRPPGRRISPATTSTHQRKNTPGSRGLACHSGDSRYRCATATILSNHHESCSDILITTGSQNDRTSRSSGTLARNASLADSPGPAFRLALKERWISSMAPPRMCPSVGDASTVSHRASPRIFNCREAVSAKADGWDPTSDPDTLYPRFRQPSVGCTFDAEKKPVSAPPVTVVTGPLHRVREPGSQHIRPLHGCTFGCIFLAGDWGNSPDTAYALWKDNQLKTWKNICLCWTVRRLTVSERELSPYPMQRDRHHRH